MTARPDLHLEHGLLAEGFELVAGLDEVGRGAWAGPVSVGVVVIPAGSPVGRVPEGSPMPPGLRDSKLVPEHRRDALYDDVVGWCSAWAVGHASPGECDRLGMTAALRSAAWRAMSALPAMPHVVLLDGGHDYVTPPDGEAARRGSPEVRTVVRGDTTCGSIAAASIVAKVTRDRLMRQESLHFPAFEFERNKGYPSPVHRTALAGWGLTSIHRRSWSYVARLPYGTGPGPGPDGPAPGGTGPG